MSGLLMIFMIFLFLMVFLPAMMYLLPVFLIIWLVSALVNSFRPRRQTGMGIVLRHPQLILKVSKNTGRQPGCRFFWRGE